MVSDSYAAIDCSSACLKWDVNVVPQNPEQRQVAMGPRVERRGAAPSRPCYNPALMAFSSIPEVLEDLKAGKMVVLVDDEDRENEGDLVIAAEKTTPAAIN